MLAVGETYNESFPACPGAVPRARDALTEFATQAGARGERLEDIRLAASEAITNVVLHAYRPSAARAQSGRIELNASYVEGEVWILVADDGCGLRAPSHSTGLGLGLALIAQLADDFQVLSRGSGGTELRMRFKLGTTARDADGQPRGFVAAAVSPA